MEQLKFDSSGAQEVEELLAKYEEKKSSNTNMSETRFRRERTSPYFVLEGDCEQTWVEATGIVTKKLNSSDGKFKVNVRNVVDIEPIKVTRKTKAQRSWIDFGLEIVSPGILSALILIGFGLKYYALGLIPIMLLTEWYIRSVAKTTEESTAYIVKCKYHYQEDMVYLIEKYTVEKQPYIQE